MNLTIVVPAYNEAKRLPATLAQLEWYARRVQFAIQIIVVDDGSVDGTKQVVEQGKYPHVQVVSLEKNAGKFAAFRAGVLQANSDWILLYDADGATPITVLDQWLPELEQYDGLLGSRQVAGAHITVQQSFPRQVLGRTSYRVIRLLTGVTYRDTQCGFKLFRTNLVKKAVQQMRLTRFAGDVELIYLLQLLGARLKEMPVEWHDVPNSKVKLGDYFNSFVDIMRIRHNRKHGQYH
ncbi:MAG: glycosyltransferase family 2 protein [Candidatus Kerfeldbacteria bacterium]|nr:glycosyltransferase family 2 protein [Candidatus Kerfeldbacteria bacterium]